MIYCREHDDGQEDDEVDNRFGTAPHQCDERARDGRRTRAQNPDLKRRRVETALEVLKPPECVDLRVVALGKRSRVDKTFGGRGGVFGRFLGQSGDGSRCAVRHRGNTFR